MTNSLKPYPRMKDSGVRWLGEVPEHWDVRRLRNLVDMRVSTIDKHTHESEVPVRLCNYVDVYKNDFIHPSMPLMRATATKEEIAQFRLAPGDVLITKDSEAWNDIGVPALVVESAEDLVSGYHLALLRPFSGCLSGAYLFRALQSTRIAYQFHVEANGVTRYGLSHSAIKSIWLPNPPVLEQAAVVRFLGYADRRICRFIRAKLKLVRLLEEQKQAIIHRAVTRGLDPNVRLRSSGVELLGEVPEHWNVSRLGQVILDGPRNGISPPVAEDGEIESFSISAIRDGVVSVRDDDRKHVAGNRALLGRDYNLIAGDILMVRGNGNIRLVGRAGLVEHDMPDRVYPDLLMRLRLARGCLPAFVVALLNCRFGRAQIEAAARTAVGTYKVNNHQVRQLCFAFPPLREQQSIIRWLSDKSRTLDAALQQGHQEIVLLREYRTRLIADVVTGKLDVRELAAQLPEEVGEPELSEEDNPAADPDQPSAELDPAAEPVEA